MSEQPCKLMDYVVAIFILLVAIAYLGYTVFYAGAPIPLGLEKAFFIVIGFILKDSVVGVVTPIARKLGLI